MKSMAELRSLFIRPLQSKRFDYNLIVLGAGSAGLVTAYLAATVKAKVALIEKDRMGGDCLNSGCVPSKALLRAARLLADARRAGELGLRDAEIPFDFAEVMARVRRVVEQVAPHDSAERYRGLGVEVIKGAARITAPHTVEVDGRSLTGRALVVATGARPFVPPLPGLNHIDYLTSDNLWNLRELPRRLVVLGGGPIGCELAQAFARFGSAVTLVELAPRLLIREDEEVSELLAARFTTEGIRVLTGHRAQQVRTDGEHHMLICEHGGETVAIPFDRLLVAVGRAPRVEGFGLEELGVELSERGTLAADALLRTNIPSIFCAGDVAGPYQFTHVAAHQAWHAAVNALFAPFKTFKVDYRVIPWATFVDPEVARVGLSEQEAKERGIPCEVTRYALSELDRALADGAPEGFIKVLTRPGSDKILGATVVGRHAGETITEFVSAMKHNLGLNRILGTIHIYPTFAEGNKATAGVWKRNHAPQGLLRWVERFHAWRRGE
ncbi:MAG: mercuric reductase [Trichloromonas sp.]|nr:mercuric reductase [Trichloromonas sp.]